MQPHTFLPLVLLLACPSTAVADVLSVCRTGCDHRTIGAAVAAGAAGDTVRIARGVYRESLRIDKDLILEGEDSETTILNGNGSATAVVIAEGATVTISRVTITNGAGSTGDTSSDAGGILNLGTLTLSRCVVRENSASKGGDRAGRGGGLRNDGTLTFNSGFIGANTAAGSGGGVYNRGTLSMDGVTICRNDGKAGAGIFNESDLTLTNCVIVSNRSRSDGGGIYTADRCTLTNCTISGNESSGDGGGIFVGSSRASRPETRLTHCTVVSNEVSSGKGAGVFNESRGAIELASCIVAGNKRGDNCAGKVRSLGYNIDGDDTCDLSPSGARPDKPGVNPMVSQLGHHGGTTLTHALQSGSPAIDAAGAACSVDTDQRRSPRPVGGKCDIGAYERPLCDRAAGPSRTFKRGDTRGAGVMDVDGVIQLVRSLLSPAAVLACDDAADANDANDDGGLSLSDAVLVLTWLFRSGAPMPGPLTADPTGDGLLYASAPRLRGFGNPEAWDDGAAPGFKDLWTSAAELANAPMSGAGWESVWTAAAEGCAGEATVTNQDSNTNVQVLAAGLVYTRTADDDPSTAGAFRNKVVAALEKLVAEGDPSRTFGCPPRCRKNVNDTLAWAREIGAYVLAADLVRYRTPAFEKWLRDMAENFVACDGRTLIEMFRRRPNNWGAMAFGSLVAIYAYLGDEEALARVRKHFVGGLNGDVLDCADVPDGKACYVWGGTLNPRQKDLTWHCDPSRPRLIAPDCSVELDDGTIIELGGLIPDDQRRGCSLCPPGAGRGICPSLSKGKRCVAPEPDAHISDWITGAVMGARILDRIGMGIWDEGQQAFKRMIIAHLVTHCELTCEDAGFRCRSLYNCKDWVLPVLDEAYGIEAELTPPPPTDCDCPVVINGRGAGASKNAGYGAYIVR